MKLLSRTAAALCGGYALASGAAVLLSALLSSVLPMPRAEATLAGALASLALYPVAMLWAFAVSDLRRVWRALLLSATLLGALGAFLSWASFWSNA